MSKELNITGILLAAGSSVRFNGNKLTTLIAKDTPMVLASLQPLVETLSRVIVVISENNKSLEQLLIHSPAKTIICHNAHLGMGASLAQGIRASADSDAWLVALADMPFIRSFTLMALIQHLKAGAFICAPEYQAQRGHPVGFSKSLYSELVALNQEHGARHIIHRHANRVSLIETNDPGVIRDIDYRHQLTSIRKEQSRV